MSSGASRRRGLEKASIGRCSGQADGTRDDLRIAIQSSLLLWVIVGCVGLWDKNRLGIVLSLRGCPLERNTDFGEDVLTLFL